MKSRLLLAAIGLLTLVLCGPTWALDGEPWLHDPSTVGQCDGKFYVWGTGNGGLVSDDGWTWHSGAQHPGGGVAADIIHIGDRYYMTYAAGGGGINGGHASNVHVMWSKTLDPKSPDYGFKEDSVVASSDGVEDCDAIDPAFLLDPTDGKLWLSYGTFFGFIKIVELDAKTGKRVAGNQPVNIAIDCEATAMMYRDGWYYLLGDHGTCCNGATSTYNLVAGRSKKVTGPYLDNMGQDMLKGGGKMVAAASGRVVGLGHFGLLDLGDGVQKFSCHYEEDLDRPGHFGVLDIRPLFWKDGWPVGGDNILKETTFTIDAGGAGLQPGGETTTPGSPRQWTIAPVPNAGGYPGMPYMKITAAGGTSVLAVNARKELVTVAAFTGAAEQLWRLDQLVDGSWRIMPKAVPDSKDALALTAGGGVPSLAKFDFNNAKQHWNLKDPAAGNVLKDGTYEIQSERSGFALELAVDGAAIPGGRGGRRGGGGGAPAAPLVVPAAAAVSGTWPAGNIDARLGYYMLAAHQKWTVSVVVNAGGDAGAPYFKIVIAGTERTLAATAESEVVIVPAFESEPEQLWRIEPLPGGTYRISPKAVPNGKEALYLTAVGSSTPTLAKFDAKSDKGKWNFRAP